MEHITLEEPPRGKLAPWQTVLIVIATWLVSTAVNWGVIQERQVDMTRRQDAADRVISTQLPRTEFDSWRQEMDRRLDRMEQKLDTLLVKR
jgi:hypothetical protein